MLLAVSAKRVISALFAPGGIHNHIGDCHHFTNDIEVKGGGAMEAQLDPKKFLRIHRSTIVNVDRIMELHPLFSGEHTVVMEDGTKLTLSRKYKDRLFELLGKPL